MTYIKGRIQRYSRFEKAWLLINISSGKVVGKRADKYPYVRVLRIYRGGK